MAAVVDGRASALGEGPLWLPERAQLFRFDILGKRMLSRDETGALAWEFCEHLTAATGLAPARARHGMAFAVETGIAGQAEHQVRLG